MSIKSEIDKLLPILDTTLYFSDEELKCSLLPNEINLIGSLLGEYAKKEDLPDSLKEFGKTIIEKLRFQLPNIFDCIDCGNKHYERDMIQCSNCKSFVCTSCIIQINKEDLCEDCYDNSDYEEDEKDRGADGFGFDPNHDPFPIFPN